MADPILVTPGQIVAPPDWDALSQQHGGIRSSIQIPNTDPRITALILANPDLAGTLQQHPIYRYYMGDGSFVEAYGQENGQDVQIVDYKPSQQFTQQQAQATRQAAANQAPASGKPFVDDGPEAGATGRRWGYNPQTGLYDRDLGPSPSAQQQPKPTPVPTNTTDPYIVSRAPDGSLTSEPNPNYKGPEAQKGSAQIVTGGDGRKYVVPIDANGKPGTPYDSGIPPDTKPGTTHFITAGDGKTYTITIDANGNPGQPVDSGLPAAAAKDVPVPVVGSDGQTYIRHTVEGVNGQPGSIYYTDQQGNRAQFPDDTSKTPVPSNAPKYTPDWNDANRDLGISGYVQQVRSRPDISKDQQDQLIKDAYSVAQTAAANVNNLVSAQTNEAGRATSERGQDVSLANQRLSASSANFGNALTASQAATKYSTGPDAAAVLPYYLALAQAGAKAYGGLDTPPHVQLGPAAAALQQMPGPWGAPSAPAAAPAAPPAPAAPSAEDAPWLQHAPLTNAAPAPTPPLLGPPPAVPGQAPVSMASSLGAGPWGQVAAPGPTGAGGVAMQSAGGGYNPSPVNQALLALGIDPQVINLFGGVVG